MTILYSQEVSMVLYKPVVHDGEHTVEQRMYLLALAASKAWKIWAGADGKTGLVGLDKDLDNAMRQIYIECRETDIFMGGVHHGRDEKK